MKKMVALLKTQGDAKINQLKLRKSALRLVAPESLWFKQPGQQNVNLVKGVPLERTTRASRRYLDQEVPSCLNQLHVVSSISN
jgi:hypothetical protein